MCELIVHFFLTKFEVCPICAIPVLPFRLTQSTLPRSYPGLDLPGPELSANLYGVDGHSLLPDVRSEGRGQLA